MSETGLVEGKEGSKRFSGTLEGEVQLRRDQWGFDGEDKQGLVRLPGPVGSFLLVSLLSSLLRYPTPLLLLYATSMLILTPKRSVSFGSVSYLLQTPFTRSRPSFCTC